MREAGSRTVTVVPWPTLLSNSSSPPSASALGLDDRQSQTNPIVTADKRPLALPERQRDLVDHVGRNPGADIGNRHAGAIVGVAKGPELDR